MVAIGRLILESKIFQCNQCFCAWNSPNLSRRFYRRGFLKVTNLILQFHYHHPPLSRETMTLYTVLSTSINALYHVWFKLDLALPEKKWKCEKITERHMTGHLDRQTNNKLFWALIKNDQRARWNNLCRLKLIAFI